MKKIRLRLVLVLFGIVLLATVLAVFLSSLISHLLAGSSGDVLQTMFVGIALKELLTIVLIVAFAALFISLNAKRIVRPVEKLSEETKRIAKGDFDTEIEISSRHDEVAELERNFAVMVKELKSIEYMRKDFVANVSHDLKTPLSIIEGYADVLAKEALPEEERMQYAAIIKKETERLIGMTSNMLRISKLSSQNIQTARNTFYLDEQIRQAVLLLEPKWSARGITLDINLLEIEYTGDEELLLQVWQNLLDNAVKYSDDGGMVKINMGSDAKNVQVKITDYGAGIGEEAQGRIFDQFFQVESSRSAEGSGLGLSIVKRIVELHNGEIEVTSRPGEGASFLVKLPFNG
ncbi:HAMP domain-containing histidine kinase [Christensenellaceae bacterium OttesenSCG-928-K19]|nr:HAMP domain-containing histidine kinase [Christensenellaceae bacterium OttesenSCG-928-K19]